MGALTFKNSAFNHRPWELTRVEVPNFFDDGERLNFHLRGLTLVKITSRGWLRDRIRFAYDGFRRQRLLHPLVGGLAQPWSAALVRWWALIYNRPVHLVVDPTHVYSFWLRLLLQRLSFPTSAGRAYAVDQNVAAPIYQGSHGLEAARLAQLVLPIQLPYEELEVLSFKVPGFQDFAHGWGQLFSPPRRYRTSPFGPQPLVGKPQRTALLQVSPLQFFLGG